MKSDANWMVMRKKNQFSEIDYELWDSSGRATSCGPTPGKQKESSREGEENNCVRISGL